MPVISPSFRIAMGVDGTVSDGTHAFASPEAGGVQWLDAETIIYQQHGRLRTLAADLGPGFNWMAAGGGVWAKCLTSEGYEDSHGFTSPDWFPLAVDDLTGTVAVLTNRHAGTGLALWNGSILTPLVDGSIEPGRMSFKRGVFAAQTQPGVVTTWTLNGQRTDYPAIAGLRDAQVDGDIGMGYKDGIGLVCYWLGTSKGLVVLNDEHGFNADMRVLDGVAVVAVSAGAGERIGELRAFRVNLEAGTVNDSPRPFVDLRATADEPSAAVPTFAPMPCRVTVFDEPSAPMAIIGTDDTPDATTIGVFCTLGPDDVGRAAETARRHHLPLLCYRDDLSYPPSFVPTLRDVEVVPTVMAYPYRDHAGYLEPVEDTAAHIAATLRRLKDQHPRIAVVIAAYRQIKTVEPPTYNWPLQHVLDLQAAVWESCRAIGVTEVLVFIYTRGSGKDGIVSRHEFQESLRRMRAASRPMSEASRPIPSTPPSPAAHARPSPLSFQELLLMSDSPAFTLLASRIKPSPEWPTTHCVYEFADGTYLSVANDGTLRPGVTAALSGETFFWQKGADRATAVRGDRAFTFVVVADR